MYSLGIDIGDHYVTGVILEQQRKTVVLKACAKLPLRDATDPADQIGSLREQLNWRDGVAVCGLPLSFFSIRNLAVPFADRKKIVQILPSELEEQLPVPIETMLTEFVVSRKEESENTVLAFALEQHTLENLLTRIDAGVDPEIVLPSMTSLAVLLARLERQALIFFSSILICNPAQSYSFWMDSRSCTALLPTLNRWLYVLPFKLTVAMSW